MISFKPKRIRWSFIFFVIALALAIFSPQICQAQFSVSLDAQPRRIAADGRSASQLTVRVTALGGDPAPDGTEVRFVSTSGTVIPVARTTGGVATAILTSASSPNISQVTALAGGASAVVDVEFVSANYQAPEIFLDFQGELAYSLDHNILIGADAVFTFGSMKISAETMEYDERRGQLRAQGGVTVEQGAGSLSADALWFSPEDRVGAILIAGRTNQQVMFRSDNLELQAPRPVEDVQAFEAFRAGESRSWILSEKAAVWPRERIQFTRVEIKVHNRTVLALPRYFYDYSVSSLNPVSQQVRYTSFEGLVVDLPFYFVFQKEHSAGIRVRYAGRGSSYGGFTTPRKGFSLGLEEAYNAPGGGGRLFLDSFIDRERSVEWNHNQRFSGGRRLNMNFRYQPISEFARQSLSGYTSYGWKSAGLDWSASFFGSSSESKAKSSGIGLNRTITSRLDTQTRSQKIKGTKWSWRATGALVNGPVGIANDSDLRTGFYQTAGVCLTSNPVPLGGRFQLTTDANLEQSFGDISTSSVRARVALRRPFGRFGELSAAWEQEFAGGQALTNPYRKSLTGRLSLGGQSGLQMFAYARHIPDDKITSYNATLIKDITRQLRLEASHNFSQAGFFDDQNKRISSEFDYTRLSLVQQVGLLEFSVNWSPQGRDFGSRRDQKFWIEMGSKGF